MVENEECVVEDFDVDNETSEIENAASEMEKLNDVIVDLESIYEEIKLSNSINKETAIAIESIAEDALPKDIDINSYTVDKSKTNLSVTLEGIIGKFFGIIKYLFKLIGKLIVFILKSLKNLIFRPKDKINYSDKVINEGTVLVNEIEDKKKQLKSKYSSEISKIDSDISNVFKTEYEDIKTDLIYDILHKRMSVNVCLGIGSEYANLLSKTNNKLLILDKGFSMVKKANLSELVTTLSPLQKPTELNSSASSTKSYTGSDTAILENVLSNLKEKIIDLNTKHDEPTVEYKEVFDKVLRKNLKLTDVFFKDSGLVVKEADSLEKKYEKMNSKIESLTIDNDDNLKTIKDACSKLGKELNGLKDYTVSINYIANANDKIAHLIYRTIKDQYNQLIDLSN